MLLFSIKKLFQYLFLDCLFAVYQWLGIIGSLKYGHQFLISELCTNYSCTDDWWEHQSKIRVLFPIFLFWQDLSLYWMSWICISFKFYWICAIFFLLPNSRIPNSPSSSFFVFSSNFILQWKLNWMLYLSIKKLFWYLFLDWLYAVESKPRL